MVNALAWVVVAATVLSGFFSTASYALRICRRVQLEEAFGARGRKRLAALESHMAALGLSASFCRSLANLLLVVAMLFLFDVPGRGWPRAVSASVTAAALIAVFSVAIPHAWSIHAGEKFLAAALPVLMFFRYAFHPAVWLMQVLETPVRRLTGAEADPREEADLAKQEILHAATEGRAEGTVAPEEADMIASVMRFGDTRADAIMTPRTDLFALPVGTSWEQARRRIVEAGHSRVPLYEGDLDNIVGVLYAKDLLRDSPEEQKTSLRGVMRKPFFVPETKPLDELLREFKNRKVHIAIVVDEYGGTAGVASIEDVLEQIVGRISDEYDRSEPALLRRVSETVTEVDGRLSVGDLRVALGLDIPQDEGYETVAGLLFAALGYVPAVGEQVEAHGAKFTILAADERRIRTVRVERPAGRERHERSR